MANTLYFHQDPFTICFSEPDNAFESFYSYHPEFMGEVNTTMFTFKNGGIWKHGTSPYCNFYGVQYDANVTLIFNPEVSMSKNFNTLNYEGSTGWALAELYSNSDIAIPIEKAVNANNLAALENQLFTNNFKRKENKYFGTIINNTPATYGEVIYGNSMNGIKGFFSTVKMVFVNPATPTAAELYSVSSNYVMSSY